MSSVQPVLSRLLVPVASETDARRTARALAPYEPESVVVLHVVEKGEGMAPDAPVEQPRSATAAAVAAFREEFPDADSETVWGETVVEAIIDTAGDVEASAIAFQPREGSRLRKFLTGDYSLRLVTEADRPVIALPQRDG